MSDPGVLQAPRDAAGVPSRMETVFSYRERALIEDVQYRLWVVSMTERVLCVMSALLYEVYDEYRLWWVPPDIIQFSRQLGIAIRPFLGSTRNNNEILELLEVI